MGTKKTSAKLTEENLAQLQEKASKALGAKGAMHNLGRVETSAVGKTSVFAAWGDAWTPEQEKIVKRDHAAGVPLKMTAVTLGRSPVAVWAHRRQMGLTGAINGKPRASVKPLDAAQSLKSQAIAARVILSKAEKFASLDKAKKEKTSAMQSALGDAIRGRDDAKPTKAAAKKAKKQSK